jgi:glycosyltransferase involved in cell wall biosynthesis
MQRQAAIEDRPELLTASRSMRLLECTAAWSADAVLTHSADEAALLRQAVPEAKVHRVPWSLQMRPGGARFAERSGVAFIGYYGHPPNLDAAQWLVARIMPRVWEAEPTITLTLVGSDMPENLRRLSGERVRVVGHVADLGADVLDRMRLTVAPLRFGAGVKAKVLESLAAGVPCVMTPVAAEGLCLPENLRAMIGRDEAELAALICQCHGDIAAHAKAVAGGVAFMGDAFGEEAVARALLAAIEDR